MKKRFALIALIISLLAPALTSISAALSVQREKSTSAAPSPFAGDQEDQQDETDPARDTDQDSDIFLQKISLLPACISLKATPIERDRMFSEHDREVGTPPPKR